MKNFVHSFKYYFRILLRTREQLFWCLLFPILLATMFHFAFTGFASQTDFSRIPVAVSSEGSVPSFIRNLFDDTFSEFLDPIWVSSGDEAEALLRNQEVSGAFCLDSQLALSLTVLPGSSLDASILESFTENFNMIQQSLLQSLNEEGLTGALRTLQSVPKDMSSYVSHASTGVDTDLAKINFYSLLGMFCLFANQAGLAAVISSQANLSDLGMRLSLTSASHLEILGGFLSASWLVQYFCVLVSVAYMRFVLGVGFGNDIGPILLITFAGCWAGVCLGFFVGSIGSMKESTKNAILMVLVFAGSAAAGLFGGNGFIEIEHSIPIMNRLNPVTLITDALYAAALNGGRARYARDFFWLLGISAILFSGGVLMQKRKKFESL